MNIFEEFEKKIEKMYFQSTKICREREKDNRKRRKGSFKHFSERKKRNLVNHWNRELGSL
jgi:hypothetical protein